MASEKYKFGFGLVAGVVISALFFLYFAPRYKVMESGGNLVKQDRWSGDTWRFTNNEWKKVKDINRDWQKIDEVLKKTLNFADTENEKNIVLKRLREKFPILQDLSDEEIFERIKMVYAREIMVEMYLKNFLRLQKGELFEDSGEAK